MDERPFDELIILGSARLGMKHTITRKKKENLGTLESLRPSSTKVTPSASKCSLAKNRLAGKRSIAVGQSGIPSVTALAQFYCGEPESALHREDLLESARLDLSKYDLESDDLDRTIPVLARTLHMLMEQNGGKPLADERKLEIERQVLAWCGCGRDGKGSNRAEENLEI